MSANSVDPDQTPHYVASDLDLHCRFAYDPLTGLGTSVARTLMARLLGLFRTRFLSP